MSENEERISVDEIENHLESEYFGEDIGSYNILQVPFPAFNAACSSSAIHSKSSAGDNTGLRLYTGAHVAIRFLHHLRAIAHRKSVIEIGCGIGGVSAISFQTCDLLRLVLTDGNPMIQKALKLNIHQILRAKSSSEVFCTELVWGNDMNLRNVLSKYNESLPFDIVIGSELMYYQTDLVMLLSTAMKLVNNCGLFLHAHLFRRYGQRREMNDFFKANGWNTAEILAEEYMSLKELSVHPEWHRVKTLVSGPQSVIELFLIQHPSWRPFPDTEEDEEREDDEDNGDVFSGLRFLMRSK